MRSFFYFFFAALKNPLQASTLFETGPTVARLLAESIPVAPDGPVAELGVGTGAITQAVLKQLTSPAKYLGVELNPELIEFVQKRFPQARFYNDSAVNFARFLGEKKAAAVISSLPWTVMPKGATEAVLNSVIGNLAKDGVFSTYLTLHVLHTPAGRRFQQQLQAHFSRIETRTVFGNLPPARVFIARL